MPIYKLVGNKILSTFQNWVMNTHLTEFHSGYRIYSVEILRQIPFHLNSNVFHFDTEIIIQLIIGNFRIKELPIPTYYGDEICHVDGLMYAKDVFKATAVVPFHKIGLFYQKNTTSHQAIERTSRKPSLTVHIAAVAAVLLAAKFSILDAAPAVARALRARDCGYRFRRITADAVDGPDNYYQIQLGTDPYRLTRHSMM